MKIRRNLIWAAGCFLCGGILPLSACAAWPGADSVALAGHGQTTRNDVETDYRDAIRRYKEGHYPEARDLFERIEVRAPDFKATRAFLQRIEQHMAYEQRKRQTSVRLAAVVPEELSPKTRAVGRPAASRDETADAADESFIPVDDENGVHRKAQHLKELLAVRREERREVLARREELEKRQRQILQARQRLVRASNQEAQADVMAKARVPDDASGTQSFSEDWQAQHDRLVRTMRRQKRMEALRGSRNIYRDVKAAIHSGRYDFAWQRLADWKILLEQPVFPQGYREKMQQRVEIWRKMIQNIRSQYARTRAEDVAAQRGPSAESFPQPALALSAEKEKPETDPAVSPSAGMSDFRVVEVNARPLVINSSLLKTPADRQLVRDNLESEYQEALENLYRDAVALTEAGSLKFAYDLFRQVEGIAPNYKDTRDYLGRIRTGMLNREASPETIAISQAGRSLPNAQESSDNTMPEKNDLVNRLLNAMEHTQR